jgi:hypothetical protein
MAKLSTYPQRTLANLAGVDAGGNVGLTPLIFSSISLTAASAVLNPGPTTPVVSLSIATDWILGTPTDQTFLTNEGGIWSGKVWTELGVSRTFTSSNNSASPNAAPNATLFSHARNNGSNNQVVSIIGDANVATSNSTCFGANFIARSNGGSLTNAYLVGCELDVEPAVGDTVDSRSGGLFINAFNTTIPVAIQIGAVGGGAWTNLIVTPGNVFAVNGAGNIFGTGTLQIKTSGGANPTYQFFDTTNGGWLFFSDGSGVARLATADTAGNFIGNQLSVDRSGNTTALSFKTTPIAVASLPAAGSSTGARTFVNNSSVVASGNFGAIVAGGGANTVPVYSDGTNWRIG